MRKLIAVLLLIVTAVTFSACKADENIPVSTVRPESEPEPEENTDIVAMVGDEIILLDEVKALLESTLGEGFEDMGFEFEDDELFDLYDGLLDVLIDEEIVKQKADELGYTNLSDADLASAHGYVDYEVQVRYEYFCELAKDEAGDISDEEAELIAAQMIAEYVAETKETDEYLLELYVDEIAVENMFGELLKDVAVSEEEMNETYLERVEQDKEYYAEHPDYFASDRITSELYYNIPDHRYVKTVVSYDEQQAAKVYELTKTVDFDTLIVEYSEDDGAENFKNGYAVCEGCEDFDPAFVAAAMALEEPGDISGIIKAADSWHIIMYVSDIPEGEVPFEEVRESLEEELLYNKCEEKKAELTSEWRKNTDVIKFPEIFGL